MTEIQWRNVTKSDRAGHAGKVLKCPHCDHTLRAGHFNWVSFDCNNCHKEVDKPDWLTPMKRSKS